MHTINWWEIKGVADLETKFQILPNQFIQDIINPLQFRIYHPNTGEMKAATKQEVMGLECAAVWEPEHIEDRLLDYFEHRPNIWHEAIKIKD